MTEESDLKKMHSLIDFLVVDVFQTYKLDSMLLSDHVVLPKEALQDLMHSSPQQEELIGT